MTPTSTTTSTTPTPSPATRADRIRDLFDDIFCFPFSKVVVCNDAGCTMYCDSFSGHGGTASVHRFGTSALALAAFEASAHEPESFHELPASFWVGEFPIVGVPWGSSHYGVFLSDCWLARSYAYDDTSILDGPQPRYVLEEIYQSATETALFADCGAAP